jgi:hypothetical protein
MKQPPRKLIIFGVVLSWLPYLVLRIYWQHLISTVPDAAHGEFSGPATYFLPRLLVAAILLTAGLVAALFFIHRRTTPNSNERNA